MGESLSRLLLFFFFFFFFFLEMTKEKENQKYTWALAPGGMSVTGYLVLPFNDPMNLLPRLSVSVPQLP
jgi:hypothetical protein